MSQSYPDIPSTTTLQNSLALLLARDEANRSGFSGTVFPTSSLVVGMMVHRTDLNKIYVLKDLTPTWVQFLDLSSGSGVSPLATALATARTITLSGVVAGSVSFDGTANVTITATMAVTGVAAGTYTKVTVGTDGRVTAGAALANSDLPDPLTRNVLRAQATNQVTLASTDHPLQTGVDAGANIAMDNNSIQGRNNGAAAAIEINKLGGSVTIGDGSTTVLQLDGTLSGSSQIAATLAEAKTGAIDTKVITPQKLAYHIVNRTFVSALQTITSAGTLTLAHGLLLTPYAIQAVLVCQTAEAGYSIGDNVYIDLNASSSGADRMTSVVVNGTNLVLRYTNTANCFALAHKSTGVITALTNANWKLQLIATC